jgi:hypothetical protein
MRFCALLFTLCLLASACGTKEEEEPLVIMDQPADLIEQDKMILILADVHLLEAALQYRAPHGQSRSPFSLAPVETAPVAAPLPTDQKTLPYYDIFAKHAVTRAQYEQSLKWYMTDAKLYGVMYDEVINELVRRQAYEQKNSSSVPAAGDSLK